MVATTPILKGDSLETLMSGWMEGESAYLLMEPNEKEGRFILQEVMMTGNMGHSDTRNWGSQKTAFKRFIHNLRRDAYL